MIDPAEKKESETKQVKVSKSVKLVIEDESRVLSRSEGKPVTQGQLIHRAIQCYLKDKIRDKEIISGKKRFDNVPYSTLKFPGALDLSEVEMQWVQRLVEIFRDGGESLLKVLQMLEMHGERRNHSVLAPAVQPLSPEVKSAIGRAGSALEGAEGVAKKSRRNRASNRKNIKRTG